MPGGRPKGSLNKSTAEVRVAAQKYTKKALKTLVTIMLDEEQPGPARVAAAREVLDRGHGSSPRALTLPGGGGGEAVARRVIIELSDLTDG